ncbi:MAG TPA: phospholipid carrier-dependent glycosyltransferase [Gaiellaceae bacterium]|jgi:hypothetical protein
MAHIDADAPPAPPRAAGLSTRAVVLALREHALVVALAVVVLLGGWLRLSGLNWDHNTHLHPDERYISSVTNVIEWPSSPIQYFDVSQSPLSPYNTPEGQAYSYGTLPIFATKAVADIVGEGDYDHLYLVGRALSALLDCATTVLVFLIARILFAGGDRRRASRVALLAATLYAFTVAAIQASHFFTTDSWLVFFGTLTFYLALLSLRRAARSERANLGLVVAIGFGTGLTVACKISGFFVAVPVAIALIAGAAGTMPIRRAALLVARDGLIVLLCTYVGFRLVSPYAFAHSSWLDLTLGKDYHEALDTQRNILDGGAVFAPTFQWLLSPRLWDPLRNLVTWQLGFPLGIAAVLGTTLAGVDTTWYTTRLVRHRARVSRDAMINLATRAMTVAYVLAIFLYMGTRFQHMGRYLLPIAPFLAILAAYALHGIPRRYERVFVAAAAALVAATGLYALAYHSIYTSRMTRLAADDWIVAHVRHGSAIANENWDDTLPVGGLAAHYKLVIVPVFDPDDSTKLRKLYDGLSESDYYVLSSQRGWRTLGRLDERYPLMVRYYRQLFAGRLGYTLAASFTSEPRLFGVRLDDVGAEEAFSVYDHPPVKIYVNRGHLTFADFRARLCTPPAPAACD